MAETQTASIGYKDQVWIHDGSALYQLVGVTGFEPAPETRELIDASTLEDLRPVMIPGRYQEGSLTVSLIYRPQSTTDSLLHDLRDSADSVAMKLVFSELDGSLVEDWTFNGRVTGYGPDNVGGGELKTASATISIVGEITRAAHA
jgi:hypothetical protein